MASLFQPIQETGRLSIKVSENHMQSKMVGLRLSTAERHVCAIIGSPIQKEETDFLSSNSKYGQQ